VVIEEIHEPPQDEPQVGNLAIPNVVPNEVVAEPVPQAVVEEVHEHAPSIEDSNISQANSVQGTQTFEAQEPGPPIIVK
jgi:hypothetical protein